MICYQIIVQGLLAADWSAWFEGVEVQPDLQQGFTCMNGMARDQAELFGLLNLMCDMNLTILKFEQK